MREFKHLAFIGRFQPFHNGHFSVLQKALALADVVTVIFGSAKRPRTIKDPFNANEREVMIASCFPEEAAAGRLKFRSVQDRLYSDQQWAAQIQAAVDASGIEGRTGIIGHSKDRSSFYLRMFPQWELVDVPSVAGLSATEIRGYIFSKTAAASGKVPDLDQGVKMLVQSAVPAPVAAFLDSFRKTPYFAELNAEKHFIDDYKAQFAGLKYPPIFVTADACVVQSGHILMVRRKALPGKGLWALPGGFVEQDEKLADSMIRELREETKLKVPDPVLRGSIRAERAFDHPDRSLRGRTITQAFLVVLADGPLHEVRRAPAENYEARWIPISRVLEMDEEIFEDHLDIIRHFIGGI